MSFVKILRRFELISGLGCEERAKWDGIVRDSMFYVESLVKDKALSESDICRLENCAAVHAYYKYSCYTAEESGTFKAGDISFTQSSDNVEKARIMWERELELVSDLTGSDFVFGRIR